ncbi:MAG: CBS domain-containing protein [Planctomycetes bacterium]|nr:CBS domain-containing protein [Planctomycetota bacterium]
MNVKDVMAREVKTIRMVDRLDAAARVLWEQDCGIVPVVDATQVLVGVVTDRDVCMAAWTQGRPLGEIAVSAVMARQVATCRPDDTVAQAMATLAQRQVHRLPVVDARGVVVGMVSCSDLVRIAQARPTALDATAVLKAIAAVRAPRRAATASAPAPAPAPAPAAAKTATASAPAPAVPASAPPAAAKPAVVPAPAAVKPQKSKGKSKKG